eukprot:13192969-Alexandrium_andersonii.AAC.1
MKPVSVLALELTDLMPVRDDIPLHFYTDGSCDAGTVQSGPKYAWAFVLLGEPARHQYCVIGAAGGHITQGMLEGFGADALPNNVAELVALLMA